ncbi:hypothetical protein ILYODFUR_036665 [Ilyodon furcidens]|uniref:Uncharacterized protein n=1 Tax=Ilyodon furcidens TaxID=33524 RepID=A0ABV0T4L8_9TELE
MRNRCTRLNQQRGNLSLWRQTSVGFHLHQVLGGVFDQFMNLLAFSYQIEFQLSSSSGNGHVKEKFASELLSHQICASVASSRETCWKWQFKSLFLYLFIALMTSTLMPITATKAELRLLNCVAQLAQMDDPNGSLRRP